MDSLAPKQGLEHTASEFSGPVKKRKMPRYVVRVDDARGRHSSHQALHERGLACPAPSVYGYDPGAVRPLSGIYHRPTSDHRIPRHHPTPAIPAPLASHNATASGSGQASPNLDM
jgi:hypothetical protein